MQDIARRALVCVVLAGILAFVLVDHGSDPRPRARVAPRRPEVATVAVSVPVFDVDYGAARELVRLDDEARAAAEAAALEEQARRAELAARVVVSRAPAPSGGWPHSDAWWHGVAMCEQGGRNDPFFGYFSFMDGSSAGKSWDEQVAMGNALLARAGREVGPWAASCVAAGYAASPSG